MSSRTARHILIVLSLGILFAARDAHATVVHTVTDGTLLQRTWTKVSLSTDK